MDTHSPAFETRSSSTHHFDLWHEVQLVPQLTGMSCWAAAAAMLIGWRDAFPIDAHEVARGAGRFEAYRDGLHPSDIHSLADVFGLVVETSCPVSVPALRTLLEVHGPLWVGEASPGLHSIVVVGAAGDGSLEGTRVRINDPWPIGRGERYSLSVRKFLDNFAAATRAVGAHAQLLHCGNGGRGARRFRESRHMVRSVRSVSGSVRSVAGSVASTREAGRAAAARPISARSLAVVPAGTRYVNTRARPNDPLREHEGSGDNLCLRWTALDDAITAIDVVIHLHGYSPLAPDREMLHRKVRDSGLEFHSPEGSRGRPSLGIIPRGRKVTEAELVRARARVAELRRSHPGRTFADPRPDRYSFPALLRHSGQGLEALVSYALEYLCSEVLRRSRPLDIARIVLTAHSGGGAPLSELLGSHARRTICNPHEVHVFDALYEPPTGLRSWLTAKLARAPRDGALRVIYGRGTRAHTEALRDVLPASDPELGRRYCIDGTAWPHGGIPHRYGALLLRDVTATIDPSPPPHPQRQRP